MSQLHGHWLPGAGAKLQVSGANGPGGVQPDYRPNVGSSCHWLSQLREIGRLFKQPRSMNTI